MSYTPNPTDPTEPLDSVDASTAAAEFRALKAYLAGGVISLPGDIIWAANNNRVGCLLCNGQAVSRTTYAALAAIASSFSYGAPYGPGDGATTFNVPDLRGRTVFGYDSGNSSGRLTGMSGGIDASHLGNVGGTQTNILVVGNLPAASITVNITDPGH
jgi:microcystin-dependent protein